MREKDPQGLSSQRQQGSPGVVYIPQ
ncbi:hypothetical protein FOXYSP1_19536 [Fusarium oxysporum f. sp. phaseoli]